MSQAAIPEPLLRLLHAYDRDLPLEPATAPAQDQAVQDQGPIRVERFEITSAHDERVPGLLLTPAGAQPPLPLVLVGHPATLDKGSDYVLSPARDWAAQGLACATIDQPWHGERGRRPVTMEEMRRYPLRRAAATRQTSVDWMRTLDYLGARPELDGSRVGFVGFSMGARNGAALVALDARVRAAAFCIAGASAGRPHDETLLLAQASADPLTFAPLMDRATLVVGGRQDDIAPPAAVQRFFDAMPEPKEIAWGDYDHWGFMPQGLAPVWPFLERQLLA